MFRLKMYLLESSALKFFLLILLVKNYNDINFFIVSLKIKVKWRNYNNFKPKLIIKLTQILQLSVIYFSKEFFLVLWL